MRLRKAIHLVREGGKSIGQVAKDLGIADYASPERAAVNPDPAQYIAKSEKWFLTPVLPRSPR